VNEDHRKRKNLKVEYHPQLARKLEKACEILASEGEVEDDEGDRLGGGPCAGLG